MLEKAWAVHRFTLFLILKRSSADWDRLAIAGSAPILPVTYDADVDRDLVQLGA